MSTNMTEVQLGGLTLRVPEYQSVSETQSIVNEINQRLKALEASSTRVNTQAFALLTAYEYAKELLELRDELAERQGEVVRRVAEVSTRVNELTRGIEEAT